MKPFAKVLWILGAANTKLHIQKKRQQQTVRTQGDEFYMRDVVLNVTSAIKNELFTRDAELPDEALLGQCVEIVWD
jgi:hypothetical protein